MKLRGFSVVELIIVITIMGILLVLGVVNLVDSETNSRDSERKIDIEAIATHLEDYYRIGVNGSLDYGRYPSVQPSVGLIGNETKILIDLDEKALKAPDQTSSSLIAATNSIQTTAGVTPSPTINQYVYQPIASDGSLCDNSSTKECRKFNLYYRLESDDMVYMKTSKNQ